MALPEGAATSGQSGRTSNVSTAAEVTPTATTPAQRRKAKPPIGLPEKTLQHSFPHTTNSDISPFLHAVVLESHRRHTARRLAAYNEENQQKQQQQQQQHQQQQQQPEVEKLLHQPQLVCGQLLDFQVTYGRGWTQHVRRPTLACFKDVDWNPNSNQPPPQELQVVLSTKSEGSQHLQHVFDVSGTAPTSSQNTDGITELVLDISQSPAYDTHFISHPDWDKYKNYLEFVQPQLEQERIRRNTFKALMQDNDHHLGFSHLPQQVKQHIKQMKLDIPKPAQNAAAKDLLVSKKAETESLSAYFQRILRPQRQFLVRYAEGWTDGKNMSVVKQFGEQIVVGYPIEVMHLFAQKWREWAVKLSKVQSSSSSSAPSSKTNSR
ncbi:hypothetical protein BASA50_000302 [Batrachochytrium salamandrivorans]|uniref:Uncharacterized protein n=1 Tax=Batrachochytrium salamandrivorans TaxID=1357716 RepID=A0ABQ8EXA8_9FUNG|nr:hypothetical protein BASA60_005370 [Batrachochytrium salamandrivorans]KAH6574735.1 hypothetical protein BASA62_002322 [Batrachochytrium salamandrivorans]KAH6586705.1 hypothetical protein BASA50_000302 [Batrachochytrium salamandrivorans]KAH6588326.1 hypothetical protein BASA61_005969 [Batrachochytrium salamandrivorans]KAH9246316.1 hypothetical protein BASA81_016148 [Batrachochytrium salamandrivorans]